MAIGALASDERQVNLERFFPRYWHSVLKTFEVPEKFSNPLWEHNMKALLSQHCTVSR